MSLPAEEFSRLILDQIDAVDRFARTLTRNPAESDDLVQETYLRALKAGTGFELREGGVRPWLFRILHNLHRNRLAREQKQPRAVEADQLESLAQDDPSLTSLGVRNLTDDRLDKAMATLPQELRTILILWGVDELAYREIADALEIPIGTVMSRLHRARRRLSEILADQTRRE